MTTVYFFFFFQAEDGIRDWSVTGVQTCALPISAKPVSMRLRDMPEIPMAEGGWVLLGERPGEEIALGLVGKFWRPVIEFAPIESAEEFRSFDKAGFAKTV